MFRGLDPNKTVRHMSFRDMRMQYDRNLRLWNRLVRAMITISILFMVIMAIIELLPR